jgi:hypothetical protein
MDWDRTGELTIPSDFFCVSEVNTASQLSCSGICEPENLDSLRNFS